MAQTNRNLELAEKASPRRDVATVREILDTSRIEKALEKLVYSAVKETIKPRRLSSINLKNLLEDNGENPIQSQGEITRYRMLPSEERLLSERQYHVRCERRFFMTHQKEVIAVDANMLDAYCVVYQEPITPDMYDQAKSAATQFVNHLKQYHAEEQPGLSEQNEDSVMLNAQWLRWSPMMNSKGRDAYIQPIMAMIDPLNSTTILPEKKEDPTEDANRRAKTIMNDIISDAEKYGFSDEFGNIDPAKIQELQEIAYQLLKAAFGRALNGITLKLILSTIEEKTYNIGEHEASNTSQSIFSRVIPRQAK